MFKKEDYSKPLPKELVRILKKYTSKKDVLEIELRTGIGNITIDRVRRGENSLTQNNSKAIEELIYIAKKKNKEDLKIGEQSKKYLEKI
jgi:translation initiation factor 2B subunit (eIF-2B alpha/beta/delta family)